MSSVKNPVIFGCYCVKLMIKLPINDPVPMVIFAAPSCVQPTNVKIF